ncbi:hypothetical protein [Flammeovirga sp. EKP202]|uniref:hypothetical protein n=1 Tax=Flammeovirga sp. EKP202 TaxID=2770592 RepID=UPI00165F9642|nr:hypothetical protein [Flammeovirga sp. EKP202]MBD0404882.1 hypothetical protein [Flammeovirga sp. EKP202]
MKNKITTTILYLIFATSMTILLGSLSSCSQNKKSVEARSNKNEQKINSQYLCNQKYTNLKRMKNYE